MSSLANHILASIERDVEALFSNGGMSNTNMLLIKSILKDPTKDYNVNAPPAYTLTKYASETSISEKPFLPPRNNTIDQPRSVPPRPTSMNESKPDTIQDPLKPSRVAPPPPTAAKPVSHDKLSSSYRADQAAKQENSAGNKINKLGDRVVDSAAQGVGWAAGTGIVRKML